MNIYQFWRDKPERPEKKFEDDMSFCRWRNFHNQCEGCQNGYTSTMENHVENVPVSLKHRELILIASIWKVFAVHLNNPSPSHELPSMMHLTSFTELSTITGEPMTNQICFATWRCLHLLKMTPCRKPPRGARKRGNRWLRRCFRSRGASWWEIMFKRPRMGWSLV